MIIFYFNIRLQFLLWETNEHCMYISIHFKLYLNALHCIGAFLN